MAYRYLYLLMVTAIVLDKSQIYQTIVNGLGLITTIFSAITRYNNFEPYLYEQNSNTL